ncbi:MAG: hypothetical protein J6Q22_10360 [Prevotella sp.]|nr:hypothetical protein [Prevotella sp.]
MRKLAYIAEVSSVEPIEGADRLEQVMLKGHGWKIVTAKGDFSVGDLGVMFEIDSYLPSEDERYAFLKDRCLKKFVSKGGNVLREGIRIKTIKLRGVISQGLLMPIDKFPEIAYCCKNGVIKGDGTDTIALEEEQGKFVLQPLIGADVTKLLKIEHYDEVKEQLQPESGNPISAEAKGNFPSSFCPKTDEIRLQACTEYFESQKGKLFEVTEKRDGSSISFGYCPLIDEEEPFMVCSRNLRLKSEREDGSVPVMWQTVRALGLEDKCKTVPNLMFQAEFCGMGVNRNRDKLIEYTIEVFRIYDVAKQEFVESGERKTLCDRLQIPHVPIIEARMDVFDNFHNMDEILPFADGKTARGNPREGLVFKEVGTTHPCTFKVVSNKYLLSEND